MSPEKLPKTLTKDEVLSLLSKPNKKAPIGLRNRCIMQLMYRAGLRESEVINLGANDIEWKEGILRVWKGKGLKGRTPYLDEHVLDLLRMWDEKRPRGRYFFCTLKSNNLNDRYIRELVDRYAEKAGIGKHVNPHMLRAIPLLPSCYKKATTSERSRNSLVTAT